MIERKFLKELVLIRLANQKIVINVTIGKFQSCVSNICHDLVMMFMNLSDVAILNIKGADYCFLISGISNCEAINIMQNIDLAEKSGTLLNINIYYHM